LASPPAETTDVRFSRVLNSASVAWPADLAEAALTAFTMGTASYSGDALSYLQQLADSERGYLCVQQDYLVLYGWNWFVQTYDPTYVVFSDSDSTKIPFQAIETSYDTDQFFNYISVTGYPGTVTLQNTTSQTNYGISYGEFPVLQAGTGQMAYVATHLDQKFSEPRFRVSKLSVSLEHEQLQQSPGLLASAFSLYIGAYIGLSFTPNRIGSAIYNDGFIIGIDISATPDRCDFTFSISGDDTRGAY
jgi:hypothetical protein